MNVLAVWSCITIFANAIIYLSFALASSAISTWVGLTIILWNWNKIHAMLCHYKKNFNLMPRMCLTAVVDMHNKSRSIHWCNSKQFHVSIHSRCHRFGMGYLHNFLKIITNLIHIIYTACFMFSTQTKIYSPLISHLSPL